MLRRVVTLQAPNHIQLRIAGLESRGIRRQVSRQGTIDLGIAVDVTRCYTGTSTKYEKCSRNNLLLVSYGGVLLLDVLMVDVSYEF